MTTLAQGSLPDSVAALLDSAADRYGIARELARAVAFVESGGNQAAVGTSGEQGVMQLMPATARELGVVATDLRQNIDGGVRYLAQLTKRFGDVQGLASYNAGPRVASLPDYRWPESTQRYVRKVLERAAVEKTRMGGRYAVPPFNPPPPRAAPARARRTRSLSSPPVSSRSSGRKVDDERS